MAKDFIFSVVMPIYKVEEYIEESILSIINQTIGFEKNIQLILVNDGSPDNSDKICRKYESLYPDNIVYIEQENAGVSAARNRGIKEIRGKYANFLDPDDLWEIDAFEKVLPFFEEHYDETDVVAGMITKFDAEDKPHPINYRLEKGPRIADLTDKNEFNSIDVRVNSSVFKTEAIFDVRFKLGLKYAEDALFVNTVIMKRMRIGFLPDINYLYRKRQDQSSVVQTIKYTKYYFIDLFKEYYLELIRLALERFGKVPRYIQNVLYYDFGWHIAKPAFKFMDERSFNEFRVLSKEVLSYINYPVITKNIVHTSFNKKDTALLLKAGKKKHNKLYTFDSEKQSFCFKNKPVIKPQKAKSILILNSLSVNEGNLIIKAFSADWLYKITENKINIFLALGDNRYTAKSVGTCGILENCLGSGAHYRKLIFKIPLSEISAEDFSRISAHISIDDCEVEINVAFPQYSFATSILPVKFKAFENIIIKEDAGSLFAKKYGSRKALQAAVLLEDAENLSFIKENYGIEAVKERIQYRKISLNRKRKYCILPCDLTDCPEQLQYFLPYLKNRKSVVFVTKSRNLEKLPGKKISLTDPKLKKYILKAKALICLKMDTPTNELSLVEPYLVDLMDFHTVIAPDGSLEKVGKRELSFRGILGLITNKLK